MGKSIMSTTTTPKRDTQRSAPQKPAPSQTRQWVTGVIAVAVIIAVIAFFLKSAGVVGGPDSLKGYYALRVNPAPGATADKVAGDMVFGFARLALNEDHTFALGQLQGTWSHSGSSLTLTPKTLPAPGEYYQKTTMADTLSIMLHPCSFTISPDQKILTAVAPTGGPLVWGKVNDGLR